MWLINTKLLLFLLLCVVSCERHVRSVFEHDITTRITEDGPEFYNQYTRSRFIPRGVNLVAEDGHTLFDIGRYDADYFDRTLIKLKSYGYNTVRVWINTNQENGISDPVDRGYEGQDGFNNSYLAYLYLFLDQLNYHDMYVIFTADWVPDSEPYRSLLNSAGPDFEGHNLNYLSTGGHEANKRFWKNFARRMKQSPHSHHILAYEIRNEFFYVNRERPFDRNSADEYFRTGVSTANGRRYDMTSATDRAEMMDYNMLLFFREVKDAIYESDPDVLVSAGLIVMGYEKIGNTNIAVRSGIFDFVDLHIYPHEYYNTFDEYAAVLELPADLTVPLIAAEFGAKRGRWSFTAFTWPGYGPDASFPADYVAARDLVQWQTDMCQYGFQGWLTWDYDGRTQFYNSIARTSEGDESAERLSRAVPGPKWSYTGYYLSPLIRPDACSTDVAHGPRLVMD